MGHAVLLQGTEDAAQRQKLCLALEVEAMGDPNSPWGQHVSICSSFKHIELSNLDDLVFISFIVLLHMDFEMIVYIDFPSST